MPSNYEDEDGNVIYPQKNGSGKVGDSVTGPRPSITNLLPLLSPSPGGDHPSIDRECHYFVYRLNVYNVTCRRQRCRLRHRTDRYADYLAGDGAGARQHQRPVKPDMLADGTLKADGNGTGYDPDDTFAMPAANVTLYAVWNAIDYTVTYDGNGEDSGTAPTDLNDYNVGDTVTVLGNTGSLAKAGYTFGGWNTQADGSSTSMRAGAKRSLCRLPTSRCTQSGTPLITR